MAKGASVTPSPSTLQQRGRQLTSGQEAHRAIDDTAIAGKINQGTRAGEMRTLPSAGA